MNNAPSAVKSAARVLDVLEMLSNAREPMRITDIAERLGIPKSSAHMLLATLVSRGYVVSGVDRRFALHRSFGIAGTSWVGGQLASLLRHARSSMERLASDTRETAFLAVMSDQKLQYVEKVVTPQEVRCDLELGTPRHLHATSPGLVMLAFMPGDRLEEHLARAPFERMTKNTLVEASRLRQELSLVRKRGYAIASDTNSPGASGVAAPILDVNGNVIAALSVASPTNRFESIRVRATAEVVREARLISMAISGAGSLQTVAREPVPPRTARKH